MKKLVLTGAAGRLGSYLREPLTRFADTLVSTDLAHEFGTLYEGESYVRVDLQNFEEIFDVMQGADMVVHFGAIGDEAPVSGQRLQISRADSQRSREREGRGDKPRKKKRPAVAARKKAKQKT